jgi:hypothetical protein
MVARRGATKGEMRVRRMAHRCVRRGVNSAGEVLVWGLSKGEGGEGGEGGRQSTVHEIFELHRELVACALLCVAVSVLLKKFWRKKRSSEVTVAQ